MVSRGEGALTAVVCRECRTLQLQLRLDGLGGRRCVGGHQTVIKKQSRHVLATRIATTLTIRQTAGCIKMPLGMEVGLSPGDFVRWGPSPSLKRGGAPQFSAYVYCGQTAAWIKMLVGTEVGLGLRDILLDGHAAAPSLKGHSLPIFSQWKQWCNPEAYNHAHSLHVYF